MIRQRAARVLGTGLAVACAGLISAAVTASATGAPIHRSPRQIPTPAARRVPPGLIVFEHSAKNLNSFIWAMRADGAHPRPLTRGHGYVVDQEPTLSPTGRRIAFLRITGVCHATCAHQGIWVMDRDGQHQHKIASGNLVAPTWSPTGKQIAVLRPMAGGQRSEIELMNADGAHLRALPTHGFAQVGEPGWSPNGRRLVFTALEAGGHSDDLYTERVDGTHFKRLTHSPGFKANPSWSPSGAQIVFQQAREGAGPWHLVVVRSDGMYPRQITFGRVSTQLPHFGSTGRWILYQHGVRTSRAYLVHPDGSGNRPVSRTVEATRPTWQQVSTPAPSTGTPRLE